MFDTMDEIAEIKTKIDIVELIGHYITLSKAGVNFKGLCPFHHERTPSFMVSPERQSFKCFGCDKGGNIFTFIQEIETVEFGDALKMLADRAGVTLKPRQATDQAHRQGQKSRWFTINKLATGFFHQLLTTHPQGKEALTYLKSRGITDATIATWRIGYAPKKKVLANQLIKRGFTVEEILQAGKPDMFHDRIMFPIVDIIGNVVGFTGRILGSGEPKYLNTPETPIFHKSRVLFGLEHAKQAIKQAGCVIITEGQMDVISAWQAGTKNVVATSGTALTSEHLRILARYEVDIIFAFDTDGAGLTATKRAIDLAISDNLSVKVIPIPKPYKDVGDIVEKDPAAWLELAKKPIAAIEWHIETVLAKYHTNGIDRKLSVDEKKKVAKELIPVLNQIPDAIEKAHYIQLLAKRLEVGERVILEALSRGQKNPATTNTTVTTIKQSRSPLSGEETLYGLLLRSKDWQAEHSKVYNELQTWYTKPTPDLIFAIEEQYRGRSASELQTELNLLLERYKETKKDHFKSDFASRISQAEAAGDRQLVKKLLTEFQKLIGE